MDFLTFCDTLPVYHLLSLLPLTGLIGLILGAIIAPFLYSGKQWLAAILNLAGLVSFVWVGCIVFGFAITDFTPSYEGSVKPIIAILLGILLSTLFFGAVEWLTFWVMRHLHAKKSTKDALGYFHEGYSCAQSVLTPFASELGLTEEQALRISAGFGAGIGRMRETCGAFCGLTFIAGHCQGNLHGNAGEKEQIFSLIREEAEQFRTEFGTLRCRNLLHLDEGTQEGARPNERSATYYAARPCERCVAFCEARARKLLNTHFPQR